MSGKQTVKNNRTMIAIVVVVVCAALALCGLGFASAGAGNANAASAKTSASKAFSTEAVDYAQKLEPVSLVLTVNGQTVAQLTEEQTQQWIVQGDKGDSVDTDAIVQWATGALSSQLDTVGSTRTYTRPDGVVCTVTGGEYGWTIDGDQLADQIAAAIQAGANGAIEVPTEQSAQTYAPGGQDWGTRYVDVDLSAQHATFYDNGAVIWESDIISGDPTTNHATPEGV